MEAIAAKPRTKKPAKTLPEAMVYEALPPCLALVWLGNEDIDVPDGNSYNIGQYLASQGHQPIEIADI